MFDTGLFRPHLACRLNKISFLTLPLFSCPFRKIPVVGDFYEKYLRFGRVLGWFACNAKKMAYLLWPTFESSSFMFFKDKKKELTSFENIVLELLNQTFSAEYALNKFSQKTLSFLYNLIWCAYNLYQSKFLWKMPTEFKQKPSV